MWIVLISTSVFLFYAHSSQDFPHDGRSSLSKQPILDLKMRCCVDHHKFYFLILIIVSFWNLCCICLSEVVLGIHYTYDAKF